MSPMPGPAFSLYGTAFRWTSEGRPAAAGEVPLILEDQPPFAGASVRWLTRGTDQIPWFGRAGDDYAYRFDGVASFALPRDGHCLRVFADPAAPRAMLDLALFRGVIPRLLHLRGTPCLHASAVESRGRVVAFVGPGGCGKSTLAAGLVNSGFPLVSDDVLPLRAALDCEEIIAGPGIPELRIYGPALRIAGIEGEALPPAAGEAKWRWSPGPGRVLPGPAPLACVFVLRACASGRAASEPLTPSSALLALAANALWLHPSETGPLARDMLRLAEVVRRAPVRSLSFELSSEGIQAVAREVVD